jgi:hypothetical protein
MIRKVEAITHGAAAPVEMTTVPSDGGGDALAFSGPSLFPIAPQPPISNTAASAADIKRISAPTSFARHDYATPPSPRQFGNRCENASASCVGWMRFDAPMAKVTFFVRK